MLCTHCGKEIPENSEFCTFCGEQQSPQLQPISTEHADAATPEQAPDAQQPAADLKPKAQGGLAGKILSLLVSAGLVIGGLSGRFVLRGTNSSGLLVAFGLLWLAYDIFSIVMHYKKGGEAVPNAATSTGTAGLALPDGSKAFVIAAALMAVSVAVPLLLNIAAGGFNIRLVLSALSGIVFIVLALSLFKKNIQLLIIPAALDIFVRVIGIIGYTPSPSYYIRLIADIALLVAVIVTVSGTRASNRPLFFTAIGACAITLVSYVITVLRYGQGVSFITILTLLCYYGAYFVIAAALAPATLHKNQENEIAN
ncbi:MAG: zinc ribbon domain-containing protein [Christensenellaceae bacterium]|nr:zinc ribbon domain-containing protein [Christensenellaceae bacterium]